MKLITHRHLVPEVTNEWSYTSVPPIRLHGVHQKQHYLYQPHGKVLPFKTARPRNPKIHHRDKISPLVLTLSCLNPITNFTIYFCNINFNIILPSMTLKVSLSSEVYKRNANPVSLTLVLHSGRLHFLAHELYKDHVNTPGRQTCSDNIRKFRHSAHITVTLGAKQQAVQP